MKKKHYEVIAIVILIAGFITAMVLLALEMLEISLIVFMISGIPMMPLRLYEGMEESFRK